MTAPGERIGPYELRDPVGAGGMGEVWRARDPRLGRDVALKLLPRALQSDPERLRRFEQEARATGALSHPNILAVHDFAVQDGTPYLVSELLDGESLRARLQRGPLPARKAIEIAAQVARGLAAAHAKGIVHRDLKPENLFLTSDGRVKILDFGLAKLDGARGNGSGTLTEGTADGAILGSVGYMAPEQVRGKPADARSDIFALGAVLHEMIAGTRAFAAETPVEVGYATLNRDPPDLPGGASPGLVRVVRRCLEKSPTERFQSADDLAFALETLVGESEPRANGVPSAASPRRPAWLLALLIVAALLAVIAVVNRPVSRRTAAAPAHRTEVPRFTRVTYRTGSMGPARFTDAGRRVVFAASVEGAPFQVFVATVGQPDARPLSEPWMGLFAVSAQGEMALAVPPPEGDVSGDWSVARASLAGGAPRVVASAIGAADFHPDGSLLFVRTHEGHAKLEFRGKVLFETDGAIVWPRFSPSADSIAFVHWPIAGDDRGTVELVDLQGHRRTLAGPWFSVRGLAWAPSGREVWYAVGVDPSALHAVTLAGQDRVVLEGPGRMALQDIAADGRVLVSRGDSRYRIYGQIGGAREPTALSWFDGSIPIDLTPDGRLLLFDEGLAAAGIEVQSYLRATDGSPAIHLASGYARALTPDGRWAVVSPEPPFATLQLVPTGAGEPRRLPAGPFASISAVRTFPDSRRILISAREPRHPPRLWVQDLTSGQPRPVGPEGLVRPSPPSPDGERVVALRKVDKRLMLLWLESGEVEEIEGLSPGDSPIQWTPDGKALYVVPEQGNRPRWPKEIVRYELSSGARTAWRALEPGERAGTTGESHVDVLITPDGSSWVYMYFREISDYYVIEGLS